MKRTAFFITSIALALSFAGTCPAADDPARKLTRGMTNIAASPFEIFRGIEDAAVEKGVFGGVAVGTLEGLNNALTMFIKGVYEVTTFPITLPGDHVTPAETEQ